MARRLRGHDTAAGPRGDTWVIQGHANLIVMPAKAGIQLLS